jgi:hypothetical protein
VDAESVREVVAVEALESSGDVADVVGREHEGLDLALGRDRARGRGQLRQAALLGAQNPRQQLLAAEAPRPELGLVVTLSSRPRMTKSISPTASPSRTITLPVVRSTGFSRTHTASSTRASSMSLNSGTCSIPAR